MEDLPLWLSQCGGQRRRRLSELEKMTPTWLGEGLGSLGSTWEKLGKALDHSIARSRVDWGVGSIWKMCELYLENADNVGFWCKGGVLLVRPTLGVRKDGTVRGVSADLAGRGSGEGV